MNEEVLKTARIVPIPAVNAVLFNRKGEVLLTRRSALVREPGKWCLPGGHLDGGEDWASAIRREMAEETGLVVTAEKLFGIYSDPQLTVTSELLPEGFYGQFVVAAFLITSYEGKMCPSHEVDDYGFFALHDFPEPMLKSHPIRVHDASKFRGEVFVR